MVTVEQYFSGVLNFVFMILGFFNSAIGGLLTHKYFHVNPFVDPILWIIPSLILILGLLTFFLSLLGCSGLTIDGKACCLTYFILQILILLGEIAVGGYWFWRTTPDKLPSLITTRATFGEYDMQHITEWTQMQTEMNCCGVSGAYDYAQRNLSVPKECCLSEPSLEHYYLLITEFGRPCEASYVRKGGCNVIFETEIRQERLIILCFLWGGALLKAAVLVASFLIPFEELVEEIGWSPVGSREWDKERAVTTV